MKDKSNAFANCKWIAMDEANHIMPENQWDLGERRYKGATFRIPCRDKEEGMCIKPQCGGLLGGPHTAENFAASFAPCIQRWTEGCNGPLDTDQLLCGRWELFRDLAYVGLT
eukprot:3072250-Pyramimonas_sp.AAC.1